jgi:glycosyltransferase involved in cell wall biosynthesis
MRIHLVAPFHTAPNVAYSHCAFTGKTLRFSRMMKPLGYEIIEYANAPSESEAQEKVVMLTEAELQQLYRPLQAHESFGSLSVIGSPGWRAFNDRLETALTQRVAPYDFIAHPFGRAHTGLVQKFPQAFHVETGIGYPDEPFGAWRIFESEAWRHYHWGRDDTKFPNEPGLARHYSWVIPNYYDPEDWPVGEGSGNYVLFLGRVDPCKGIVTIADIIKEWEYRHPKDNLKFVFAGSGDMQPVYDRIGPTLQAKRVEYRGPVLGRERAAIMGQARAMLMPTVFVEPFGGSGVESMLTGTPLITSDWGAFTETVIENVTGWRCKTLNDWVVAIENAENLNRERTRIAQIARSRYTLSVCGALYDKAFRQIDDLRREGWYTRPPKGARRRASSGIPSIAKPSRKPHAR